MKPRDSDRNRESQKPCPALRDRLIFYFILRVSTIDNVQYVFAGRRMPRDVANHSHAVFAGPPFYLNRGQACVVAGRAYGTGQLTATSIKKREQRSLAGTPEICTHTPLLFFFRYRVLEGGGRWGRVHYTASSRREQWAGGLMQAAGRQKEALVAVEKAWAEDAAEDPPWRA